MRSSSGILIEGNFKCFNFFQVKYSNNVRYLIKKESCKSSRQGLIELSEKSFASLMLLPFNQVRGTII